MDKCMDKCMDTTARTKFIERIACTGVVLNSYNI